MGFSTTRIPPSGHAEAPRFDAADPLRLQLISSVLGDPWPSSAPASSSGAIAPSLQCKLTWGFGLESLDK